MTTSVRDDPRAVTTTHTIDIDADPDVVYGIVADVTMWPYTFAPTVHAEVIESDGERERLRLWALANGNLKTWTSQRRLDPDVRRVSFAQETPAAPVMAMSGEWIVQSLPHSGTRVELLHHFRAVCADSAALIWRAVETNSNAELAALKQAAELGDAREDAVLDFDEVISVDAPPERVYEFLYRADLWPGRLPHVDGLELDEPEVGVQWMNMDTRAQDGSVHTTSSVRVCLENRRIVYKQTQTPPGMAAHVGEWTVTPSGKGAEVSSRHIVVIQPDAVASILGPQVTIADAGARIRDALRANSMTTMRHAKAAAEEALA